MDRLSEIRARCEAAKAQKEKGDSITAACIAWSIVINDVPYLLAEIDRLNAVTAEYTSNSTEITINGRQYVPKDELQALTARAEPANKPLTLEQLREMEQHGEGIYVTHADGSPIFRGKQYTAAVLDRIAAFGAMGYHLQAIYGRGLTLAEDDCGKTWLAYRHKLGGEHNA